MQALVLNVNVGQTMYTKTATLSWTSDGIKMEAPKAEGEYKSDINIKLGG